MATLNTIKYARRSGDDFAVKLYTGETLKGATACALQIIPAEALDPNSVDLLEQYCDDCIAFKEGSLKFYPLQVSGTVNFGPLAEREWTNDDGVTQTSHFHEWFEHGMLTVSRLQATAGKARFVAAL